jgi:glutamyl-tRNA reductase
MLGEVRELMIIDLGSPPQVSEDATQAPNVRYVGLDQLAETTRECLDNTQVTALEALASAAAQEYMEKLAQTRFRTLAHHNQSHLDTIVNTDLPKILDAYVSDLPEPARRDFEHQLRRLFRDQASSLRHALVALDEELGPPALRLAKDQDEPC